jgi:hypothetical protein
MKILHVALDEGSIVGDPRGEYRGRRIGPQEIDHDDKPPQHESPGVLQPHEQHQET